SLTDRWCIPSCGWSLQKGDYVLSNRTGANPPRLRPSRVRNRRLNDRIVRGGTAKVKGFRGHAAHVCRLRTVGRFGVPKAGACAILEAQKNPSRLTVNAL